MSFYKRDEILDFLATNEIISVKDFREKNRAMYLWYCRHKNIIGELPLTKIKRNNFELTEKLCFEIAKKYQYRSDLQKHDKGAYIKLLRLSKLNEACAHMVAKPPNYQTEYIKNNIKGKPAKNRKELVGQQLGDWFVKSIASKQDGYKDLFYNCVCKCGTENVLRGQNIRSGISTKCTKCSNQVSKPVKEIYQNILNLGFSDALLSYKDFGFEVDIYVPSKNLIIEFDGLIWHSSKFRATEGNEKERYKKLKETGASLFRIFADEYENKKELVESMIKNRLGITSNVKPGNVAIKLIKEPADHKEFFIKNHLDGYGRATFAFGAFDGEKLISCMSFRPYMSGKYKGQFEISRFCNDNNINTYGMFSKILKAARKYLKENNAGTHIVSASDNRFSDGKVYANNGFKLEKESDNRLNYYYYLHSKGLRLHRTMGKKLHPPEITEHEAKLYPTENKQTASGLTALIKFDKWEPMYKIWGWGNKLWVLKL